MLIIDRCRYSNLPSVELHFRCVCKDEPAYVYQKCVCAHVRSHKLGRIVKPFTLVNYLCEVLYSAGFAALANTS